MKILYSAHCLALNLHGVDGSRISISYSGVTDLAYNQNKKCNLITNGIYRPFYRKLYTFFHFLEIKPTILKKNVI